MFIYLWLELITGVFRFDMMSPRGMIYLVQLALEDKKTKKLLTMISLLLCK